MSSLLFPLQTQIPAQLENSRLAAPTRKAARWPALCNESRSKSILNSTLLNVLGLCGSNPSCSGNRSTGLFNDLINRIHAVDDAPEHCVIAIQLRGILYHDKELAAGTVGGG